MTLPNRVFVVLVLLLLGPVMYSINGGGIGQPESSFPTHSILIVLCVLFWRVCFLTYFRCLLLSVSSGLDDGLEVVSLTRTKKEGVFEELPSLGPGLNVHV